MAAILHTTFSYVICWKLTCFDLNFTEVCYYCKIDLWCEWRKYIGFMFPFHQFDLIRENTWSSTMCVIWYTKDLRTSYAELSNQASSPGYGYQRFIPYEVNEIIIRFRKYNRKLVRNTCIPFYEMLWLNQVIMLLLRQLHCCECAIVWTWMDHPNQNYSIRNLAGFQWLTRNPMQNGHRASRYT